MLLLLLLLSFALSLRAEAGEIIGGHEARPHSRPYMASLRSFNEITNRIRRCGGFLIQNNVVLTAAHCNGRNIKVKLGAHDIKKTEEKSKKCTVCAIFPHGDYNKDTDTNDIMLLKLCQNVKLTKEINILSLPDPQTKLKPGQECSVAGWGMIDTNKTKSNKLMEVELKIQNNTTCERIYKKYDPTVELCAGSNEGKDVMAGPNTGKDGSCPLGDSGGPLVCDNVAQGIAISGDKEGKTPGVYTRISSFLPWIDETLRKM